MSKDFSVSVKIGGAVDPSLDSSVRKVESKFAGLTKGLGAIGAATTKISESFKGLAGVMAGVGLGVGIRSITDAVERYQKVMLGMTNTGRTMQEIADGTSAMWKVFREVPTSDISHIGDVLSETTGAFGDFHHAIENLKSNVKLGEIFKGIFKDADPGSMLQDLAKFAENTGRANDPAKYNALASGMAQAMTYYQGKLSPGDFLGMARNSGGNAALLSDRFITRIAPFLIQELGADRAGTGLTGFENDIFGRSLNQRSLQGWLATGLLNPNGVVRNKKNGELKGFMPGSVKGTALAASDPDLWIRKVLFPSLKRQGINVDDDIALKKVLSVLFPHKADFGYIWALASKEQRINSDKDAVGIGKVLNPDSQYGNQVQTLAGAIEKLKTSFGGLLTAIGSPSADMAAKTISGVADGVRSLADTIEKHPNLGKGLAAVGTGLGVLTSATLATSAARFLGIGRSLATLAWTLSNPIGITTGVLGALYALKAWNPGDIVGKIDRINEAGLRFSAWATSKMDLEGWLERTFGTPADVGAKFESMAKAGFDALVNFDWGAAGRAIVDKIGVGLGGLADKFKSAALGVGGAINGAESGIGSAISRAWGWAAGKVGLGSQPQELNPPGGIGHRAAGGPVDSGRLYLVGENGPELLWTGGLSGTVIPNGGFRGLDGLPGFGGGFGGGGGGLARGYWNGSMGRVGGPSIGHTSSQEERADFIRSYAAGIGIDPAVALRVAQSEGFYSFTGDHGMSHGDFQMYLGGGLGNIAERMGINTRDPNNWKESDKFALDWAAKHGWGDWHGAARVGISNWRGINAKAVAAAAAGGRKGAKVTHAPTFNANVTVHNGQDAQKVKATIFETFRQMEREQRGAFND